MIFPTADDARNVGRAFIASIQRQAWNDLAALFDPEVRFRGLIPRGLRDGVGRTTATSYLQKGFGDADQLILESSDAQLMHDRLHITYRHRAHEDQWHLVEQHAYATIVDGKIKKMDLPCSGSRPESAHDAPRSPCAEGATGAPRELWGGCLTPSVQALK